MQMQGPHQNRTPVAGPMGGSSGPSQPLTMVAPSTAFHGEAGRYPWYRVSFAGGVDLRQGPSIEAPRTGETLCQNATFAAAEELLGADGRVYLRLADMRGWAFDDYALFPQDPSVARGYWQPVGLASQAGSAPAHANPADVAGVMGSLGAPHPGAMGHSRPEYSPWG
mmetsp:Transcript_29466/g.53492  ORF Transcript_29466/g.53492 Transcript_29466/m.53492 type:complete len:167 (-) Transcript_29466:168-668(-)|eukprot:CAMPEP_0197661418 /NCGR_PEP_ID=MMETSP1338-20131121/51445_1 /TAXON_ID=43686 ORGANISM="Pelagodinium beii, Strain RCC1491" /NCGR_SAMPLE_ID=MMETSP1338 /ASSEMBLY_ACC=CAM_ASM_000754 /LENGTH=166 /DNA_ID=CAMNT_0043238969 /DNA_START=95 /DNA_END=595 /DNA_ORIENTATION=+